MTQKIGGFVFVAVIVFLAIPVFAASHCGVGTLPPCSALGTVDGAAEAGIIRTDPVSGLKSTVTASTFTATVMNLVNWFSWFIGVIAVVMGLYAGFLFITARGEPAQLQTAKKILLYAVIGIAVAILAFSIIAIAKAILGL